MNRTTAFACLGVLLASPVVQAGDIGFPESQGLLIDHQPHNVGGLGSDTLFSEVPGGQPVPWQLIADDFRLLQSSPIARVVFWGWYDSNIPPAGDETMRLRIYDARPSDGLPGNVLFEQSFLNVPRVPTGQNVITFGGGPELKFEMLLPTPFMADSNTDYWIEVAQIQDLLSAFRWEFSQIPPPANGQAYSNPNSPEWAHTVSITSNTAYQLYSIPEPTATVHLGLVLLCCFVMRRRRTVRRLPSLHPVHSLGARRSAQCSGFRFDISWPMLRS